MKVLFATDGEAPARAAAEVIGRFFDPDSTTIDTFSVARPSVYDLWASDGDIPWESLDIPTPSAHAIALDAAEWFEERGFEAWPRTADGNAAVEIIAMAEGDGYDMVAVGGGRTSWLGNVLLGSVSLHVLHHTTCSVLVAHEASPAERQRALIATDGSDTADVALRRAVDTLDRNTTVRVATVVPYEHSPVVMPHYGIGYELALEEQATIRKEVFARGHTLTDGGAALFSDRGFDAEGLVLQGSPATQLLKETENWGAGLVVVGSRGRGPLRRSVLGSVSDRIVRHAPATLVVRPTSAWIDSASPEKEYFG